MAGDNRHNGWKNYETWLVRIWLDNDLYSYEYYKNLAQAAGSAYDFAEMLKDDLEANRTDQPAGVYTDLLTAALAEVDWYEIASELFEEWHE